jgi:carbohydrate diacid regulator
MLAVPLTALHLRRVLDVAGPHVLVALDVTDVLWVVAGSGGHPAARRARDAARTSLPRGRVDGPMIDAGQVEDVRALADLVRRTRLATRSVVATDMTLKDLELPVLLADVDDAVRAQACQRLLAGLDPDLKRTIRALLAADLVVSRAALTLNVHRNTLLGRLDRIARITGRDPRRFADAAALHAGLLLEQAATRSAPPTDAGRQRDP